MKYRVTYKCYVEGVIYETYEIEAPNIETAKEDANMLGNFVECTAVEVDKYLDSQVDSVELCQKFILQE